uniref:Uncharacterized protein n=1 Tax=Rhizophora mucronata TaxID=61149 RepID=A0A2P2Q0X0_RHIMU
MLSPQKVLFTNVKILFIFLSIYCDASLFLGA